MDNPIRLTACNCDGEWHVSIPDPNEKGQWLTIELDVSDVLATERRRVLKEAIDTICNIESCRENRGEDFITWEQFKRIQAVLEELAEKTKP